MARYKPLQPKKGTIMRMHRAVRVALIGIGVVIVIAIVRIAVNRFAHLIPFVSNDTVDNALSSKRALSSRVIELENTIAGFQAQQTQYNILLDENTKLKTELGRGAVPVGVLAHPITLPDRSFYDTFVLDAGTAEHIAVGQHVYAFNMIALGTVVSVEAESATVQLFSAPGLETAATAEGSDVTVTLVGRGGGEYEVRMPRNVPFEIGSRIGTQSVHSAVLAEVEKVITDPRDPFQRLLAKVPINLQALKWVVVR